MLWKKKKWAKSTHFFTRLFIYYLLDNGVFRLSIELFYFDLIVERYETLYSKTS